MAEAVALEFNVYKAQMKAICTNGLPMGLGPDKFASFDDKDYLGKVKSIGGFMMVLEPVTYETGDTKTDYFLEYMNCAFMICKVQKPGDHEANDQIIEDCKEIARKVMARIRKNAIPRASASPALFRNLKIESIKGYPSKITADGRIGYSCEFQLNYQISLAYHPNDWTDTTIPEEEEEP